MRLTKAIALCAVTVMILQGRSYGLTGNGGYDAAIFQADYIQDLTEYSSGLVNPALLYRVNQLRAEAGFYRWNLMTSGSMGYQEFSFIYPHRLNHTFGMTIIGNGTNIMKTDVDMNSYGTGSYSDIWYVLQYSWRVRPWLVLGTNVKIREERQYDAGDGWGAGAEI
jgi:hypothetical protein